MKKYYGYESKQDFIDALYETEMTLYYKDASYDVWLDATGYCIGMVSFKGLMTADGYLQPGVQEPTIKSYETVEELVDDYVFYDGVSLADVLEMDISEY